MSEREVNSQKPSQISRDHIGDGFLNMEVVDHSRKRKLQTEELELLPLSKHVCFDNGTLLSKSYCDNNNNSSHQCSEIESVKDSNSFSMEEDSEYSTSAMNSSSREHSDKMTHESLSSALRKSMIPNPLEFVCGAGELEGYTEKDIVDILYPDDEQVKQDNATYVLSSGRWNVNQDSSRKNTKKPTIDQEFEQYFSMLML